MRRIGRRGGEPPQGAGQRAGALPRVAADSRPLPRPGTLVERVGPELALLLVVGVWAATFVVTKATFTEISPLAFTFVRFLLMLALALGALAARSARSGRAAWVVQREDLPRFLAAGLTGYTLYQLGFVLGLDRTSPFSSSLLIALVPVFTLVLLALAGEPAPLRSWLGVAVAVAGVVIFLADKRGAPGTLLGDLLSLGAGLAFAAYGLANRPLVRRYPIETYTAYTMLAGGLPLLLLAAPAAFAQDWRAVSALAWLGVAFMVIFPVYLAYMLWNWAIGRRGADRATRFSLLVPILSGLLAVVCAGEAFGPAKLLGAALVLAGLVLPRLLTRRPGARVGGGSRG